MLPYLVFHFNARVKRHLGRAQKCYKMGALLGAAKMSA